MNIEMIMTLMRFSAMDNGTYSLLADYCLSSETTWGSCGL